MKLALMLLSVMIMMMMTMRETSGDPKTFLIETVDHENQEALSLLPVGTQLGHHQVDFYNRKNNRRKKSKEKKSKKKRGPKKIRSKKKTEAPTNEKQPIIQNEVKCGHDY